MEGGGGNTLEIMKEKGERGEEEGRMEDSKERTLKRIS